MSKSILQSAVLVCVGTGLFALHAMAQTRHFSADDLPKIVRVTDPQISPDGKMVAFIVSRANLKEDRWDPELDVVDVASKTVHVMTHDRTGVGSPRWSPNGDRIAFLAQDTNKKGQIYILPMAGGDATQLTHAKTSVTVLTWHPDGSGLAFGAPDEDPEKKDEAKFEDGFEVGNNGYLERNRALPTHLWSVSATTGAMRRLTSGEWSLPNNLAPAGPPSQITYTPDGALLLFVKAESPLTGDNESNTIQVLNLLTGAIRPLTDAKGHEGNPVLSPDGAHVVYRYPRDGKPRNEDGAYVAPIGGGAGKNASQALDYDIGPMAWTADSKSLVLAAADGTSEGVWTQPLDGGAAKRMDLAGLTPAAIVMGKDGSMAFTATAKDHPAELYYMPPGGKAPVQMTHLQTVTDGLQLGKMETVEWTSDKFHPDGVLTYPPDYVAGRKYPMLLYIHGGPTSASLETFSPIPQILAAQGWLIFEPNYRGSNNRGNAFESAIVQDAGAGPGRDVMAGVAMLKAKGIVDEAHIAVSGWSYGGYMTSWLIGNYPTAWCAAVAGAPVTDLVDQYTLSDNNIMRAAGYGPSPFVGDNMKSYAAQSPITYAWKVKAPTLILSDVGDWRVTTTQAYKLYHALKDNNVTVKFVAYPVPGHSPADPIRSRNVWRRWTAWLAPYMNAPGGAPAQP